MNPLEFKKALLEVEIIKAKATYDAIYHYTSDNACVIASTTIAFMQQ